MSGSFVLDASVALAWVFSDQADAGTQELLGALTNHRARVPTLWWLEITNVLLKAEREGLLTSAETARFVSLLRRLPIDVDPSTPAQASLGVLSLGRSHGLSSYDAAYLDLALRDGLPLATRDKALQSAAEQLGVRLL